MNNLKQKLISRSAALTHFLASGSIVFSLFTFPLLKLPSLPPTAPVNPDNVLMLNKPTDTSDSLAALFFGLGTPATVSGPIITSAMNYVASRNAFPASLSVIERHESEIRQTADEQGVPQDVAIGVALLENGGSETSVSPAGALGVFQLMPGTARNLGLTVSKKVDERKDVSKNIEAGITYLKTNFDRFGDWGLATWAYHAGEGNVGKALAIYEKAHGSIKPTINQLLSDTNVKKFTKKLSDDSAGYPYKVIATAALFEQAKSGAFANPGTVADNAD